MSGTFSSLMFGFLVVFNVLLLAICLPMLFYTAKLRRQRDVLVEEKNVVFSFIYDVSEVFAEEDEVDLGALMKRVVSYGLRVTGAKAGALYLLDDDHETLHPGAVIGMFPLLSVGMGNVRKVFSKVSHLEGLVRERRLRIGDGIVGQVVTSGAPILIEDAKNDPRIPKLQYEFLNISSILLVPMRFRHSVLGVLGVVDRMDARPFTDTDQSLLQALADQASVSINYAKFSAALDDKRRMDYDLNIARRIQTALLPKDIPHVKGLELDAFSMPAQEIGGDYYDFINVDDDHLGIVIADVAGKGVSGALVMSICRSLLRTAAPNRTSPGEVLRAVNRMLSSDLEEDMFVSILYMVLDLRSHELVISRGGHVSPILCERGTDARLVHSRGIALGLGRPDIFDEQLEEITVRLSAGDMVVVYTDGVTEAQNAGREEWGQGNLMQTVNSVSRDGGDAAMVSRRVRQRLVDFSNKVPQYDDMTLVVVQVST